MRRKRKLFLLGKYDRNLSRCFLLLCPSQGHFFSFKGDVVHTKMATKYLSYDSLGRAYFPTYAYLLLSEPFPQAESDLWPTTFIFPSPFLQFEQIEKRQQLPSKKRCTALSINSTSFMLFSCLKRGNHGYNEHLN